jgi:hypothetical protein
MRIFLMGAKPRLDESRALSIVNGEGGSFTKKRLEQTGWNTGNQVIAYGLLETLRFDSVSWDDSIGPQRVNDEYDMIVIAAANFLHTGFNFEGMANFIEATKLPCAMIGVGAQSKDYSPRIALQPGTERLMRIMAERSRLIGVRGPFTAEVLANMGIHNVQITGCPSYYMGGGPELKVRKLPLPDNPKVMVNSSRDVVSHAFDRERMIEIVCGIAAEAIRLKADFAAQTELEEIQIAETNSISEKIDLYQRLVRNFPFYTKIGSNDDIQKWFLNHMKVYWDVKIWLEDMKKYDFVFGNRFHGNMVAIQSGTPACVICHDTRTTEMCDFFGFPYVSIMELPRVDVQDLYDRVNPDAIAARYRELYPAYKRFLEQNGLSIRLSDADSFS